ncbi:MAG: hypothetical protein IPO27_12385 [Bacteroidetes bacterium]|nr:hypothetical protein [Bacteroidota bacterium]
MATTIFFVWNESKGKKNFYIDDNGKVSIGSVDMFSNANYSLSNLFVQENTGDADICLWNTTNNKSTIWAKNSLYSVGLGVDNTVIVTSIRI